MGKKKQREKDAHKRENEQVEEGDTAEEGIDVLDASTGNKNDVPTSRNRDGDKNEKGKRMKKRKSEIDTDAEESRKSHKKHKKSEDVVEVEEISKQTTDQESSEAIDLENNGESKRSSKDKHKKWKKEKKQKLEKVNDNVADENGTGKENSVGNEIEFSGDTKDGDGHKKKKKKKKQKLEKVNGNVADENGTDKENSVGNEMEFSGHTKDGDGHKKKKKKQKLEKVNGNVADENGTDKENSVVNEMEFSGHTEDVDGHKKKKKKQKLEKVNGNVADESGTGKENSVGNEIDFSGDTEDGNGRKKKKKSKSKSVINDSEGGHQEGDQVENATPKDKSKKVSFRDQVEVFPSDDLTDDANKDDEKDDLTDDANKDDKKGLVYGKRYSKEEDELVMNAVAEYIESHNLGDEGLNMVMNCRGHPQVRNCWKEIQTAIPWRPVNSVYHRAHVIFERDEKHPWTPEELEVVQKFVEKHGPKWRLLADSLGKHRHHVKDTWRRIRLTNTNKGRWSQQEYQSLFDLVNLDLSMKANQERISKHGMLRDNICWTAISDKLETRPFVSCCDQWYRKLASPMVAEGIWADADDYRMMDAISSLDACCMEDVDWDNLLEHRSGDLCRKRWDQMVRHLGPTKGMSFAEQVDVLAKRFRPDMAEARETYDSKRPIDLP
ncbi:hypothetical protein V6N13_112707 [Hibiscus sabdariffa]|uniref:Uncharacterized protein n=1 Tax=Hibiscus sabdariffa TaxID=183260 RepID=A0ABR2TP12_9ROSI